jgi:predicted lipid-binding transport protein (Tim44 family)
MLKLKSLRVLMAVLALGFSAAVVTVDHADARRGGGFGSRGARTFNPPAATQTAPRAAPIERSTTPQGQQAPAASAGARQQGAQSGGLFGGGLGRGLVGGLIAGGLLGMMFGGGFGGMAGLLGLIVQIGIIVAIVMVVRRLMARRSEPAAASAGAAPASRDLSQFNKASHDAGKPAMGAGLGLGLGSGLGAKPANAMHGNDLVGITPRDLDLFEQLLIQVQSAFAREDYAALRTLGTPEVMSYFAEELSQNATNGLKNEVTDIKLLQGDLSEAWREGDTDYATVAMRYELRDVMRDRTTGALRDGDVDEMIELTEVWTFMRERGGDWKLSAIQDV